MRVNLRISLEKDRVSYAIKEFKMATKVLWIKAIYNLNNLTKNIQNFEVLHNTTVAME